MSAGSFPQVPVLISVRNIPDIPVIVIKGHVAHWSGFQEEVGTETVGTLTVGFTIDTGGMISSISKLGVSETETESSLVLIVLC